RRMDPWVAVRRSPQRQLRSASGYLRRRDPVVARPRRFCSGSVAMSELANLAVGSDLREAIAVARQPILDRKGQVIAHELLYRHTVDATACTDRGDSAGARTLHDAVLSGGRGSLTQRPAGGRHAAPSAALWG